MINRIKIDPKVMMGKPIIKGTRIPVYVILNLLAEGYDFGDIIKQYPDLKRQDIMAVLKYAAQVTKFRELAPV